MILFMSEVVANELILRNLQEMHHKIDDFRDETKLKLSAMDDKLTAMREHLGPQKFDITNLYARVEFLVHQIDILRAQLPQRTDH